MLTQDFAEALRGGANGMVSDMAANHGRPWGFPLDEIEAKVLLWYCALDRSVPPAMGRYLNNAIPGSQITLVSDAGHLWILLHLREVLNDLLMVSD
jgi:pimeloyl-ACP methyl ester carboxylesterase